MRFVRLLGTVLGSTLLTTTAVLTAPAQAGPATPPAASSDRTSLDASGLRASLDAAHEAGLYGVFSAVRDGGERWTGASGVADVATGRPVTPGMRQRVGSISKTFTAVAVLQQVERGRIRLDAPVADYLPDLIPGERGREITVRMLLNHTSGIGDHVLGAFPSLLQNSPASLDEERFRSIPPEELVRLGLAAPATGRPGELPGTYSNTNYAIAGLLLEKVTGQDADAYVTRHVIHRAGLRHTSLPRTPYIKGPHPRMYEALYGLIDPPRDYSVYDMSWIYAAGAVVSTMDDLNRFYRALLAGKLVGEAALGEMLRTVPVGGMDYGLGILTVELPGCGRFWGHSGAVFGAGTFALTSRDGKRQVAFAQNLMKYQSLDENGRPLPHPIDEALTTHIVRALCPDAGAAGLAARDARGELSRLLPGIATSQLTNSHKFDQVSH
ncbi:serine hydrolase domain-containing protein [Streptomyces lomondensis]|uniref:Hydrolase n=1 Tax=Streptomyces lomondensis TaxID=68229 RepID=A0ABQ2XFL2_9ACTN|nr:serine hydrolase domain-containing protein [Streptomyces lomondensis]MCF0077517.1 beta-lactamase family protein [Streptomyces lomondensis]GGX14610.1 hydrolase [Streptomyces lomondensis]